LIINIKKIIQMVKSFKDFITEQEEITNVNFQMPKPSEMGVGDDDEEKEKLKPKKESRSVPHKIKLKEESKKTSSEIDSLKKRHKPE